jgi:predicted ribosome quality control (RQC) complex YloA/Tae2 family protein
VRLNPKLSATGNAELYFKRARKAERRAERVGARREELQRARQELRDLAERLAGSPGEPDAAWFEEARRLGVKLPPRDRGRHSPPEERLPSSVRPRRYDLGGGWEALVGKSRQGNDVLTHEIARPHETWMHADQAAGSHLVLRHQEKGKEPPETVLLAAARIAAYFSKARHSAKVPVLITEKRHVRRPRKGPPGTALVGKHRTVMVEPGEPQAGDRNR